MRDHPPSSFTLRFAGAGGLADAPLSRQVAAGLTLALLAHLLFFVLAVVWKIVGPIIVAFLMKLLPARPPEPAAPPKLEQIELTIVQPPPEEAPAPAPLPQPVPQRPFLDSRGLAESTEAPKNASVESDKDMKAASELPATGALPLPSQDGLARPTPNFTTQENTLGAGSAPMEAPSAPALYKPQPIPKANIDPKTQEPAREMAQPDPAVATPPTLPQIAEMNALAQRALDKLKQVMEADEDEIPLTTKPMVTPPKELTEAAPERPRPQPIAQPKTEPRQEMAKLTTPPPRAPQAGYQPQLQKTRIEGSISNRGKAAVDAVSTPLARYKKQVNDAIGSRWYHYIRGKMDLIAAGSVHMSFSINDRGEAVGVRIDSNTSNQSLADVCERAIREAELEPPPPDLIAPLKDGQLEYSLTFTFYNL